jgi:cyclic pyranopterin phosphate synthase
MPEHGIKYANRSDLLTYEEMHRLIKLLAAHGVHKVRITGGEPFVRNGMMDFLKQIRQITDLKEIHITTNGTFTKEYVPMLEDLDINSINLSLDSLDKERFFEITRRDVFDQVMETYQSLLASSINVKINAVVMDGRNIEDIYPMLALTKNDDVSVRFIEEMPFNGTDGQGNATFWPMKKILAYIAEEYNFEKLTDPVSSTSSNYQIKGHRGSFGIIAAYTRSFCGTCNRIRVTPQGGLKTCLYDQGTFSLRDVMRSGATDEQLLAKIKQSIGARAKDGFEAENARISTLPVSESMATIGG